MAHNVRLLRDARQAQLKMRRCPQDCTCAVSRTRKKQHWVNAPNVSQNKCNPVWRADTSSNGGQPPSRRFATQYTDIRRMEALRAL
jgi:hypothetical protein